MVMSHLQKENTLSLTIKRSKQAKYNLSLLEILTEYYYLCTIISSEFIAQIYAFTQILIY